jgi:catechol 2,3-dioxygenase-like lactoylglutathione lyase family enzyme
MKLYLMEDVMRTCLIVTIAMALAGCASTPTAKVATDDFTSTTVDFGIVVSDIDKSLDFYKNGLGLTQVATFDVSAVMGRESGLSDDKPFKVYVLKLGDGPTATSVKLMQFCDAPGKKQDNTFIHSTLGVSYLTIWVQDTNAAVARAKAAGGEIMANGPYALPDGSSERMYLTCVRDPDGNIVEMVGPKK